MHWHLLTMSYINIFPQLSRNTRIRLVDVLPGRKMQFRIAAVNSSGIQGIGPASPMVRTLFNASRPSGPETVWAKITETSKDTVDMKLSWLPPEKLGKHWRSLVSQFNSNHCQRHIVFQYCLFCTCLHMGNHVELLCKSTWGGKKASL